MTAYPLEILPIPPATVQPVQGITPPQSPPFLPIETDFQAAQDVTEFADQHAAEADSYIQQLGALAQALVPPVINPVFPTNTNAPPPTSLVTTGAFQTVAVPSGYTVSRAQIMAPAGSTNAKTLKGITGDTGLPGWTGGSVTIPVVAGSSFGITSTVSGEALIIAYS